MSATYESASNKGKKVAEHLNEPTRKEILADPIISKAMDLFDGKLLGCVTPDQKVYRPTDSNLVTPSKAFLKSLESKPSKKQKASPTKPYAYWYNLAKDIIAKPKPYRSEVQAIQIAMLKNKDRDPEIRDLLEKKCKEAKVTRPQ